MGIKRLGLGLGLGFGVGIGLKTKMPGYRSCRVMSGQTK